METPRFDPCGTPSVATKKLNITPSKSTWVGDC